VAATQDVVGTQPVAVLDEDLRKACLGALAISRAACRQYAETVTWESSARSFLGNLVSARNFASEPSPAGKAAQERAGRPRSQATSARASSTTAHGRPRP